MAKITGPDTVKDKVYAQYTLQSNESIDERSIIWSISTVVSKSLYEIKDYGKMTTIIEFHNANDSNLNVSIRVEYKLKNGTKGTPLEKKVTLLGKTADKMVPKTPQEARPDTGNKSVTVNTPDKNKTEEKQKGITLKLHVYFDGTFGNKHNIDKMDQGIREIARIEKPDIHNYTDEEGDIDHEAYNEAKAQYKKKLEENKDEIKDVVDDSAGQGNISLFDTNKQMLGKTLGYAMGDINPTNDNISYTQVYTNIPIMYDLEKDKKDKKEDQDNKEKIIKIYIEGVGTINDRKDDILALIDGSDDGGAGIKSKIKRAFEEIKDKAEKIKITTDVIEKVEICVLGFSRGAAAARNFVSERKTLLSTLKGVNKTIGDDIVTYKFVGVFDTVCSVSKLGQVLGPGSWKYSLEDTEYNDWITKAQRNNLKEYKLAMRGDVEEVVQLAAADEYRKFFPLTSIQSSIDAGCGLELVLPGSHCDIGGGDAALVPEKYEEEVMNYQPNIIPKFLIEGGWFPDAKETPIVESNPAKDTYYSSSPNSVMGGGIYKSPGYDVVGTEYTLQRTVTVGYNRIPLSIMLHYAEKLGGIEEDGNKLANKTTVHKDLLSLKKQFLSYVEGKNSHKRDSSLLGVFERNYKHLRHSYLHVSAIEDGSFFVTAKNMSRTDDNGALCRAVFNDGDTGVSLWEYYPVMAGRKVKEFGEKIWEEAKEKGREVLDAAKEKLEDAAEKAVEAGKEAVKDGAKKIIKGITDKLGRPTLK